MVVLGFDRTWYFVLDILFVFGFSDFVAFGLLWFVWWFMFRFTWLIVCDLLLLV